MAILFSFQLFVTPNCANGMEHFVVVNVLYFVIIVFKTSLLDWKKRQELTGWKSAQRKAKYSSTVPNRTPH